MVKLSEVEVPIVFKNQLLFKAGNWNRISFSNEMVGKSVDNTKWSALNKRLYLKHDGAFDVSKWKGKVENIKNTTKDGNVEVRGDVEIWDADEGVQILYGGKPVAISADIEYNEAGTMFFTGFAIENDPGVRDTDMFLSDAVKNELNGMYHAKFSNQIDTTQTDNIEVKTETKTETQINPIDNQSAERRFNDKQTETMTELNSGNTVLTTKETVDAMVKDLETSQVPIMTEPAKAQVITEVPKEQPKVETQPETVATKELLSITPEKAIDDRLVNTIVDKLAEKLKDSMPKPVTVNEFANEYVDPQEETVNKLAESLAKM